MPTLGRFHYLEAIPPASSHGGGRRGNREAGTLLLIHGFPLTARMWEPQLELARRGWRVIAPHLRGFGGAPAVPAPARSLDDFAGDLVDLLDALHVGEAVVGGLSMGGYIAFALIRRAPRYVRGLILADTRAQADSPEALEARRRLLAAVERVGASAAADEMLPKLVGSRTRTDQPQLVETLRAMILGNPAETIAGAITALMTRPDSQPLLATIACPTLVIVGEEDGITPPPMSEAMQRAIPGAELVVIPAAGHMSNMEQPAEFNRAVADFLDRRL